MSSYTNLPLIDAFEAQRMVYKARYSYSKKQKRHYFELETSFLHNFE